MLINYSRNDNIFRLLGVIIFITITVITADYMSSHNISVQSENYFNPIKILLTPVLFILIYGLIPVFTCAYLYVLDEFEELREYLLWFINRVYLPVLFIFWLATKLFASISIQ